MGVFGFGWLVFCVYVWGFIVRVCVVWFAVVFPLLKFLLRISGGIDCAAGSLSVAG